MSTTPEPDISYVASLKIEKVVKASGQRPSNLVNSEAGKREVLEVTHMTIKARDLDDLKSRLGAHVNLVEDD